MNILLFFEKLVDTHQAVDFCSKAFEGCINYSSHVPQDQMTSDCTPTHPLKKIKVKMWFNSRYGNVDVGSDV